MPDLRSTTTPTVAPLAAAVEAVVSAAAACLAADRDEAAAASLEDAVRRVRAEAARLWAAWDQVAAAVRDGDGDTVRRPD